MQSTSRLGVRASALAASALICFATAAQAQEISRANAGTPDGGAQDKTDAAPSTDIVVTGSRVVRSGYDAPTPTTVVGQEELQKRNPSRLIDLIAELPQFYGNSNTSSQGGGSTGTGGQSFANLRALGANRTLVLLDGQRIVPTTAIGTVDISLIPEALIKRVDIVTGGASAAFGSDAVAGVVNFALDTSYVGFKGTVQAGATTRGDGGTRKFGLTIGRALTDRLKVIVAGEYFDDDGVPPLSRSQYVVGTIANPAYTATNGQPAVFLRNYVYAGRSTRGGLIVGGPLNGLQFLPGGGTSTFVPCGTLSSNALQACNGPTDLFFKESGQYLNAPNRRYNGYGRVSYEPFDGTTVYADALYARSKSSYNSVNPYTATYGLRTIASDNAYLPVSVRTALAAAKVTSFQLGSGFDQLLPVAVTRDNEVQRYSLGFRSDLSRTWKLNGYATYGVSHDTFQLAHDTITANLNAALDAVVNPATNQVVCRSTLTAPTNGCVPLNTFGGDQVTAAAQQYVIATGLARLRTTQFATGINLTAEPFSTWAGPVSAAIGGEYRSDKQRQEVDAISAARGFVNGNPQPFSGSQNVKEAYGEVVVPLAKDVPLLRNLELNAAGRITDYNLSGSVTTWKFGVNYAPFDGIRFRATRSRDIRAPNVTEFNAGGNRGVATVLDPVKSAQLVIITFPTGNPNLVPEKADTVAAGVVLQPRFLEGFSASVDYYKISIKDAIGTLTPQDTINFCQGGITDYCGLIARDSAGNLVSVNLSQLNVGQLKTSGIDYEVRYDTRLGSNARLGVRALATQLLEYRTNSNFQAPTINQLGVLQPKWTGNLSADLRVGSTSLFASARYLGPAKFSNTPGAIPDLNDIKSVVYVNSTVERAIEVDGRSLTVFMSAKNLLNRRPPFGFEFNGTNYDVIGRRLIAGIRFELK